MTLSHGSLLSPALVLGLCACWAGPLGAQSMEPAGTNQLPSDSVSGDSASTPPAPTGTKAERIRALVEEFHALDRFHGTVLVAEHGQLIVNMGVGLAHRALNVPFTPDMSLRLASITKVFTAVLVHQQIEAGQLSLDTLVGDVLPEFRPDLLQNMTIRHLLEHATGLPYIDIDGLGYRRNEVFDLDTLLHHIADQAGPREEPPGTRFKYSNTGFRLLAAVLVHTTGMPYPELLRRRILEPAGMAHTGCEQWPLDAPGLANAYSSDRFGGWHLTREANLTQHVGGGNVYASAMDLYRFDRALHEGVLLGEASRKLMTTRTLGVHGLGWEIPDVDAEARPTADGEPATVVFHSGGLEGSFTHFVRYLEDEHVIVVLANVTHDPYEGPPLQIATQIANILYDQPVVHPVEGVRDTLYRLLKDEGVETAVAFHEQWRATHDARPREFDAGRATGPPDATGASSYFNAWFPAGGEDRSWLECTFEPVVSPTRIQLHGTHGQRAITQVEIGTTDGRREIVPWSPTVLGTLPDGLGVTESPIETDGAVDFVRLKHDHSLVTGVNVVDAIALMDASGQPTWALTARASSSQADHSPPSSTHLPDERQLLDLGRHLVDRHRARQAVLVHRFVLSAFGGSAAAYSGLAVALRASGDVQAAEQAARSALEIDAESAAAQDALDQVSR